jgi:hypothetical protein
VGVEVLVEVLEWLQLWSVAIDDVAQRILGIFCGE